MINFVKEKEDKKIKSASLKAYINNYPQTSFVKRLSSENLSFDGKDLTIPLFYAINKTVRLLKLVKTK